MAIYDGITDLDFAYKGFQYPIPPTWKRAIRLEDQINWLLQAILVLNENGLSGEGLEEKLAALKAEVLATAAEWDSELDKKITDVNADLLAKITLLEQEIINVTVGIVKVRNPITGGYDYASAALRNVMDASKHFGATYADLVYLGIERAEEYGEDKTDEYISYDDLASIKADANNSAGVSGYYSATSAPVYFACLSADDKGRMITREIPADAFICYFALDFYARLVIETATIQLAKSDGLINDINTALNCAITPSNGDDFFGKTPGYQSNPTIFRQYQEVDNYGVAGYINY